MANILAPSAIIFVNADLVPQIQGVITRQFFLNDIMSGTEFDSRVSSDSNYVSDIHSNGSKILVMRPLYDYNNRNLADLVLFCKNGLASVECNKFGPPGITFPMNAMYLSQIFNSICHHNHI